MAQARGGKAITKVLRPDTALVIGKLGDTQALNRGKIPSRSHVAGPIG
jgi:hypothetical protein